MSALYLCSHCAVHALRKEDKEAIGRMLVSRGLLGSLSGQHVQETVRRMLRNEVPPKYKNIAKHVLDEDGVEIDSGISVWVFPPDIHSSELIFSSFAFLFAVCLLLTRSGLIVLLRKLSAYRCNQSRLYEGELAARPSSPRD